MTNEPAVDSARVDMDRLNAGREMEWSTNQASVVTAAAANPAARVRMSVFRAESASGS